MGPTQPKQLAVAKKQAHWYELDWFVPFRDLFLVFGFGLVVCGIAMLCVAAAVIVCGLGFMAISYVMSR